jgi:hypothetical protein
MNMAELEPFTVDLMVNMGLNANQVKELAANYSIAISLKRLADRLDDAGEVLERAATAAAKSRIV